MSESQKSKKQIHQDKIYHESKKYSKYCILLLNDENGSKHNNSKTIFNLYLLFLSDSLISHFILMIKFFLNPKFISIENYYHNYNG